MSEELSEGFKNMQRMMYALEESDLFPDRKYSDRGNIIKGSHSPYRFKELLPATRFSTRVFVGEHRDLRNSPCEDPQIYIPTVVFDLRPDGTFLVDYRGPWTDNSFVNYKGRFSRKGDPMDSMALPIQELLADKLEEAKVLF